MTRSLRFVFVACFALASVFVSMPLMAQSAAKTSVAFNDGTHSSSKHKSAKAKSTKTKSAEAKSHTTKSHTTKSAKRKSSKDTSAKDTSDRDDSREVKTSRSATGKSKRKNTEASSESDDSASKPEQVASFGDWGAFLAEGGKDKTCYVLAQPTDREPSKLKRDPAYVFISSRPGENIHNEVSITMGFPMKDGGEAQADVAGTSFDLVSKGKNAWVKNPAEESHFIAAMKRSATLVVKAASIKGNMTTDSYSLTGLSQALARVDRECR